MPNGERGRQRARETTAKKKKKKKGKPRGPTESIERAKGRFPRCPHRRSIGHRLAAESLEKSSKILLALQTAAELVMTHSFQTAACRTREKIFNMAMPSTMLPGYLFWEICLLLLLFCHYYCTTIQFEFAASAYCIRIHLTDQRPLSKTFLSDLHARSQQLKPQNKPKREGESDRRSKRTELAIVIIYTKHNNRNSIFKQAAGLQTGVLTKPALNKIIRPA
ncbi:hypothetical protein V8C42DRAFT_294095 [Trichoderma barbatum]